MTVDERQASTAMKTRIGVWTAVGVIVACAWVAYALATAPDIEVPLSFGDHIVRALGYTTCPPLTLGVAFPWVVPANGVVYALFGLVMEAFGRKSKPTR